MTYSATLLPDLIKAIADTIDANAEEVTALDQAIGDGDHVINLQRGITAVLGQAEELSLLEWPEAWQKIGMTLMSTMGGASGSLFGTLFVAMSKACNQHALDRQGFAEIFNEAVNAVKKRGRAEAGEKTMLDVLVPVADALTAASAETDLCEVLKKLAVTAETGVESTRDMLATKGRASFLEERSRGHIDAGAKTSQLMISAVIDRLLKVT